LIQNLSHARYSTLGATGNQQEFEKDLANAAPHILQLTSGSDAGGVSRYLLELGKAMADRGGRVTIAGERGVWHSQFESGPWRWVEIPAKGGFLDLWRASARLASALANDPPDVIHAHYRKSTLLGRLLQRRLRASSGHRVPMLYTLHLTGMPMSWPWRMLSDFGDFAHAPSEQARRWLIDVARVPADRIAVIPHGVRPERFPMADPATKLAARSRRELPAEGLVAAFVGRLEDPKNEGWLLDLAAKLPHVRFLLAGDGPNRSAVERRIAELGLVQRVVVLGDCDPLPVYHAADALLLPSAREGFAYVCAEAMSCGIPILRTRTAGTEEMIIEGITGRSCPIDHDAFLAAGLEFLADPASLARMGQAAAEHVRQHLTFDRQVEQTIELYQRLAVSIWGILPQVRGQTQSP
jgi:glycosyltransferase involved in cell wall biosynthesis